VRVVTGLASLACVVQKIEDQSSEDAAALTANISSTRPISLRGS
jgi:hypothetical protein